MPSNGRCAYGPLAERFAHAIAPLEPIIIFDHVGAGQALLDSAGRAMRNERHYVRAILQRPDSLLSDAIAPGVLDAFGSTEDRRFAFGQAFAGTLSANNTPLSAMQAYDPGTIRAMQALLRLSDGLLISSEAERRRITQLLDSQPTAEIRMFEDPSVPPASSNNRKRDAIVVWAPHLSGDVALAFAYALADLHHRILVISQDAPRPNDVATFFSLEQASDALSRALVIVDANAYGCDATSALARWGAPIVADVESGANESYANVHCFDRSRFASLHDAVVGAIGAPAPHPRYERTGAAVAAGDALLETGPLVSIVIPTLDRPQMLKEALLSISLQTYRNIETIVVVDGGPRLDELAAMFPLVRFLHMPENNPLRSSNTAFAETTGKYVAFLNDDDLYFPYHIASLVTALERSHGRVAHGDVLTAFLRGSEGAWSVYGFESNMSRAVSHSALLVGNQIGMTSCMFRRDCIPDQAPFEEAVPLYRDYALWLRLAAEADFVHVERLTSCYTIRNDGAGQQSNMWYDKALVSYEILYAQYPATDRPRLAAERQHVLAAVTGERMKLRPEPAVKVDAAPWPLWGNLG